MDGTRSLGGPPLDPDSVNKLGENAINRIAALAALVVGIALIVTTLALSLFDRAYAGQRIADGFGQVMSPEGVVQQKQGLDLVGAMVANINESSPVFARRLGMSGPAYDRFVAANYPAVATGLKEIPPAATTIVAPVVAEAQKIQGKWDNVIHIPGLGLPIAGAPWIMLLGGAALLTQRPEQGSNLQPTP